MKKAICILAAGKGKRMLSTLPKVLMPLQGKPLLAYLLGSVFSLDLEKLELEVFVLVSPDNQKIIQKHFSDLPIRWVIQENALGTGHAAQVFLEECQNQNLEFEKVLFLYGDHPLIQPATMESMLLAELSVDSPLLMLTTERTAEFTSVFAHWGRILRDTDGKISDVREYREASLAEKEITEVNPGIMAFDFQFLKNTLPLLKNNNLAQEYYLTDMPALARAQSKNIIDRPVAPAEVLGVNTPQELAFVEESLKTKK